MGHGDRGRLGHDVEATAAGTVSAAQAAVIAQVLDELPDDCDEPFCAVQSRGGGRCGLDGVSKSGNEFPCSVSYQTAYAPTAVGSVGKM